MKNPKEFDLDAAVKELGIDRPVMRVEPRENGGYRLYLYAGGFVDWPPAAPAQPPATPPAPKKSRTKKPGQVKQ